MQGFSIDKIKVETGDLRNFILLEAFNYTAKDGAVYIVPAGSESDGASTPPILWEKFDLPWIPPFGWYGLSAYLHDWAYRYSSLPKSVCDNLLLESMYWIIERDYAANKINIVERDERYIKAKLIYDGVAVRGASSFDEDRKKQKILAK